MEPIEDILETTQSDTVERLKATPGLSGVEIILDDEKALESRVEQAMARAGGLCLIVLRPEVDEIEPNLPGPFFKVRQEIQVIEQPTVNRSSRGTGIRCGVAAIRTLRSLHLATLGSCTLHGVKEAVKPFPVREGYISYLVSVTGQPSSAVVDKPAGISAEYDDSSDTVVLTCATPDARIFLTIDGSYPRPGNESSQLYTGPVADLPVGTCLRAAAYAPEMNPGDVIHINIDPS